MSFEIKALSDILASDFDAIIDVRSPAEYAEDHIPGAINLPALSDEERAQVGTIYTQQSPFLARKIGAALVARNVASHLENTLREHDGGWKPLIYCWRGGQRSGSFTSILQQIGWRADVLVGGYQSYRRQIVRRLYDDHFPAQIVLLDGNTGTGKTSVLNLLPSYGIQSIDLEALANHRGSALGGYGTQPSQKAFETRLAFAAEGLDERRYVVVEAESSKIGRINIPPRLFAAMRNAPRIRIEAPIKARAEFLLESYGDVIEDATAFKQRLDKLVRLQGWSKVEAWKKHVDTGNFHRVATELMQQHYDPRYEKVRVKHTSADLGALFSKTLDPKGIAFLARGVAEIVKRL